MKFTDKYIQSLKPKDRMYQVREGHGFGVRILPSGLRIWIYTYTLDRRRHQMNLGHYPLTSLAEAREKYHEATVMVSKGENPQARPEGIGDAQLTDNTIDSLITQYKKFVVEQHYAAATVRETKRTLDKYVLPVWKNRNSQDIRRRDAIALIEPLAAVAPGQARGVMKITRAMFNYALEREIVDLNPFTRLSAAVPSVKSTSTSRVLSDVEIKTVWNILHSKDAPGTPETRRALLVVLVTAQRPGEVTGMPWSEIGGKWWTIRSGRIKTRNRRQEDHRVYLSPLALRLIGKNPGYSPYAFIGSSPKLPLRRHALSHLVSEETEGGRPDGKGNLSVEREKYFGFPRWTPHDLRRTAATKLSELGCPDEIIDAILNHAKTGVIGVYNRNKYDKEKREWLIRWARHLKTIVK